MIVYVLTVRVDRLIIEPWVKWMQEQYIPTAMNSGHFTKCSVYKVHRDERGGRTYALHLMSKTDEDLDQFLDNMEPTLLTEQKNEFRGRFSLNKSFLGFLEEVNERIIDKK